MPRRGSKIREASLVMWPAYPTAGVTSIRSNTELQQWVDDQMQQRHARSEQVKAEIAELTDVPFLVTEGRR